MTSLRICHVIHNTEVGGTETMLFQVLQQLSGQHEMSVVSLIGLGQIGEHIERLGIPVYVMQCAENGRPRPAGLLRLVQMLRQLRPDVVQTWAYHADLCGGLAARAATRARVIWNIRHATLDSSIDSKNVLRSARLCGRLSKFVPDRILLNAEAAVDVHAQFGYARDKMTVLPNGFDTERFSPSWDSRVAVRQEIRIPEDAPVVGMCGRFHPHKGQDHFVRMARHLFAACPNAYFVVAGQDCDSENVDLVSWIQDAGLEERFRLLGCRRDVPRVLNALDVYTLPSITEAMPNAVGEAMACSLFVVSSDVGDARRLIGDYGQIVPAGDDLAMAQAVQEALLQPARRDSIGQQARKRIQDHFEISHIASLYASMWRETFESRATTVCPTAVALPMRIASKAMPPRLASAATSESSSAYRPKLVHVTTIPLTQWLFLRGQNEFMKQHGFDVHAVSSPGPYLDKLRQRDRVTTHEIAISRRINPLRDSITAWRLFRLFREIRPEIVQLSTPKAALLGALAAKAARVPVRIYHVRGLSSECEVGVRRRAFQRLEAATDRLCNACLVNANSLLDYSLRNKILKGGFVAGMGMSNGIDLQHFKPETAPADLADWDETYCAPAGPVIGYVGRHTHDKGIEDLSAAWRVLRGEFPTARLLLVGPWEVENPVSPDCRYRLESDDRVIVTGIQDDVARFYKCMDVFAYPSHGTEGLPNAPMEAAAMGLPVVVTRVVGCVDAVVDGVTGRIIPPHSPDDLASTIRDYLHDSELRTQHGAKGRARVRTGFMPQNLWAEFRDYYFHLMRRHGLPLPTEAAPGSRQNKAA